MIETIKPYSNDPQIIYVTDSNEVSIKMRQGINVPAFPLIKTYFDGTEIKLYMFQIEDDDYCDNYFEAFTQYKKIARRLGCSVRFELDEDQSDYNAYMEYVYGR
jgi:hypothetical protein